MIHILAAAVLGSIRNSPERIESFRRAFQQQPSQDLPAVLSIFAIVAAACVGIFLLDRIARVSRRPRAPRREDYLARVAGTLGLRWREVRDLRWIARHAGISQPCALVLSPTGLATALNVALGKQDNPPLRRRVDTLCRALFGVPLPQTAAAPSPRPTQNS